jgi:galactokinase
MDESRSLIVNQTSHLLTFDTRRPTDRPTDRLTDRPSSTILPTITTVDTTGDTTVDMASPAAQTVPETQSLADIYPEDALKKQSTRWNALLQKFQETYHKNPDFVSRSPGRVNIIGEVCVCVCFLLAAYSKQQG